MHIYTTGYFNTTLCLRAGAGAKAVGSVPTLLALKGGIPITVSKYQKKHIQVKRTKCLKFKSKQDSSEVAEKAGGLPVRSTVVLPEGEVTSEKGERAPWEAPASADRGPQPSPASVPSGTLWVLRGTTGLAHLSPSGALPCPDHPDPDPAAQLFMRQWPQGDQPPSTFGKMRSLQFSFHELNLLQSQELPFWQKQSSVGLSVKPCPW